MAATVKERCLQVLAEGPTTTNEIAVETGLIGDTIARAMNELCSQGRARRAPFLDFTGPSRNAVLWSLPSYECPHAKA